MERRICRNEIKLNRLIAFQKHSPRILHQIILIKRTSGHATKHTKTKANARRAARNISKKKFNRQARAMLMPLFPLLNVLSLKFKFDPMLLPACLPHPLALVKILISAILTCIFATVIL